MMAEVCGFRFILDIPRTAAFFFLVAVGGQVQAGIRLRSWLPKIIGSALADRFMLHEQAGTNSSSATVLAYILYI